MSEKKTAPTKQQLRKFLGVTAITKPKRASTYYSLEKKRPQGRKKYKNKLWRELSNDEKAIFEELAQLDEIRYKEEIVLFNDYLLVEDEIHKDIENERKKEEELKKLKDDIRKSEILNESAKNQNIHLDFGTALDKCLYGPKPNSNSGTIVVNNNVPGSIAYVGSLTMFPPTRDATPTKFIPHSVGYVRGNVAQHNVSSSPQSFVSVTNDELAKEQTRVDLLNVFRQASNQKADEGGKRKVIVIDETPKLTLTELPKVTPSNSELAESTKFVSEELQCSICMDRKRNTINVPCGHTYSCILCVVSEATLLKKPNTKLLCNKCRAPIDKVVEVFL